MPATSGNSRFETLAGRWHALAERRLAHYAEIYESGRWTLYFDSRREFAAHMIGAMTLEKTWARLAGRAKSADGDMRPAA